MTYFAKCPKCGNENLELGVYAVLPPIPYWKCHSCGFYYEEGKENNDAVEESHTSMEGEVKRYRKRPLTIEAIQFTGDNSKLIKVFAGKNVFIDPMNGIPYILTLEGSMRVDIGDYVIKGIKGEFYPCKKDIFNETYESVNE